MGRQDSLVGFQTTERLVSRWELIDIWMDRLNARATGAVRSCYGKHSLNRHGGWLLRLRTAWKRIYEDESVMGKDEEWTQYVRVGLCHLLSNIGWI